MTKTPLSIAIMSGKGGVGKSNLALNLGYALSNNNSSVLLLDCDLGLANQDILLGITPQGNLQDVLADDADLADVLMRIKTNGSSVYDILPAASGVPELVEMDHSLRDMLLRRLEPELSRYEFALLDLGAGINATVQAFAAMARMRVIILTPEPTSLTDSYALIKVLHSSLGLDDFYVVVNQVENSNEDKDSFKRLSMACDKFIGIQPKFLGSVRMDQKLPDAVRQQKPLLELHPNSNAAKDINRIAANLETIYHSLLPELAEQPVFHPLQ